MQFGLISTSTSDVVIETSLVSPVDTKQVQKAVRYCTASVHTRTERYDIVSFRFLVHFSVPPNFWTCFGTDRLIFSVPVWTQPLSVPLFGTDRNGTLRYRIRVNRANVSNSGSFFRSAQFLDLFWNGPLDFFPYPCERNPSPSHFLERTEMERYDIVSVWAGPMFLMILASTKILLHTYKLMQLVCLIINNHMLQNQCCLFRLFWKLFSSTFFGHIICKLICNYEHQVLDENSFSSLTSITLQGIKMSQKDLIEILLRRPTVRAVTQSLSTPVWNAVHFGSSSWKICWYWSWLNRPSAYGFSSWRNIENAGCYTVGP